jgi:hypothetical protein
MHAQNAKMYTECGNGCFTRKEMLSICLLGIMQDIGSPLKTYERIVALFKNVITKQEQSITNTFPYWHTAIEIFSQQA